MLYSFLLISILAESFFMWNRVDYFFVIVFSRIFFSVLYRFSDFLFTINYYFINYRKFTVKVNLKHSFPELSKKEIKNITKKFYQNFSDYIVKTIKLFTLSKKEIRKIHTHLRIENLMHSCTKKCCNFSFWTFFVIGNAIKGKICLQIRNKYRIDSEMDK